MMPAPIDALSIPLDRLVDGIAHGDVPSLAVGGLSLDSRSTRPGEVFLAVAGTREHGMAHAARAVAAGACAILFDPAEGGQTLAEAIRTVPCFPVDDLGHRVGLLADRYFGEPSRHLDVTGVTGTNGKTSCTHFLAHCLNGSAPAGVIGTLGYGMPGRLAATTHTTPNPVEMHALLARLLQDGFHSVAIEASSHGLAQGRLAGVRFGTALFTNLSRDHLDYHRDMDDYLQAKLGLFQAPGLTAAAFNLDDPSAAAVQQATRPIRRIGYSYRRPQDILAGTEVLSASGVVHDAEGIAFRATFGDQSERVRAPVFGEFNVENLLGTLAVLLAKGLELDDAAQRLARVRAVPGRMERFGQPDGPAIVVDYAHTPDALDNVLRSLRPHCEGELIAVFGCGGDRDRGKRPIMAAIAERYADRLILTDDNPRHENGDVIIREMLSGCTRIQPDVIRDRRTAIAAAIGAAGSGDVVLIAGKGHEDYQDIAGVKYPFSDREIVQRLLGQGGGDATQ